MKVRRLLKAGLVSVLSVATVGAAEPGATAILDAVKQGNHAVVRTLVKQRVDVNTPDRDGSTPLHFAAELNDLEMTALLLRAGANVRAANRYGVTPLWLAAQNGNTALLGALLKAGADPNAVFGDGQTVLMTAARTGNPEAVKALIAAGADVDAKEGWYGETALMIAASENNAAAVKVLLESGAAVNLKTQTRALNGVLRERNFSPGALTAVVLAAREGAVDVIRVLADAGADLNVRDPQGFTPLLYAILNAQYDAAAALLEKGADPNAADSGGRGPLFAAVDQNTFEWSFARPPARPSGKLTAVDLVKKLLAYGADPNARLRRRPIPAKHDTNGNLNLGKGATPFLKAASTADVELMRILLDWGASPYLTNDDRNNALMIAAGMDWRDVGGLGSEEKAIEAIKICMEYGLDVNAYNRRGQTAMHGAAMRGGDSIIKFLLAQGAALDLRDKDGRTPLDEALGRPSNGSYAGGVDFRHDRKNSTVAMLRELTNAQGAVPLFVR